MSNNMIDLDLDKLANPVKNIKIDNRVMALSYPSIQEMGKLLTLADKLKNGKEEDILTAIEELANLFKDLIPELGDYRLNLQQIMALTQVFNEISVPDELKDTTGSGTKKN